MIKKLNNLSILNENSLYESCGDVKLDMANCIVNGNVVVISILLQKIPTLIHDKIKVRAYIYIYIIRIEKHPLTLNFLSYVNVKDDLTPILYAASNGSVGVVECLVEHGASLNDKDEVFNSLCI